MQRDPWVERQTLLHTHTQYTVPAFTISAKPNSMPVSISLSICTPTTITEGQVWSFSCLPYLSLPPFRSPPSDVYNTTGGGEGEGPFLCVPSSTNGFWICSYSPLLYLGPPFLAVCVSPLFFSAFHRSSVPMYLLIFDPLATTRKYVCTHPCRFLVVLQCSPIGEKFPPTIVWHILYTKMKNLKISKTFWLESFKTPK